MNFDCYVNDILNPFFTQLTAEKRQYGYFQQDAHMANTTIVTVREVFEDNNQQRTVASQKPRIQFLRYLSLGKPGGKTLKE